jgi:5'-3' exonuclease
MGIPSYFSFIAKNYSRVLEKIKTTQNKENSSKYHNLYLDCNSIVYDAVHGMTEELSNQSLTEFNKRSLIIERTLEKIKEYIYIIEPSNTVFIAFDGVAPAAKMNQQKSRRVRSSTLSTIIKNIDNNSKSEWDTTQITPGTIFMNELSKRARAVFNNPNEYNLVNLIVSPGDESGEGEHKIFEHIRNHPKEHESQSTIIYGLDADLIMLSINHLRIVPIIYLYRETPHFIKSISKDIDPDCAYLLNINALADIIAGEIGTSQLRVTDYTFICFFLGNDFLPHFPSINIRTGGIDKMMEAYSSIVSSCSDGLLKQGVVNWKYVKELVAYLEKNERRYFINEVSKRDRYNKCMTPFNSQQEEEEDRVASLLLRIDNIPTNERVFEQSIAPALNGWENRYYRLLFGLNHVTEERKKEICINYLEGLEWVAKYYSVGCPDWEWTYKYHYPPLLQDLIKYIPSQSTVFVPSNESQPVTPVEQLFRVLPKGKSELLPKEYQQEFNIIHENDRPIFQWAFCRYFWESSVE